MPMDNLVFILGISSSASVLFSSFSLHKKRMLIFILLSWLLGAFQYALLGIPAVFVICIIGTIRTGMVLASLKHSWLNHWIFILVFMIIHTVSFALLNNWGSLTWVSFLPLFASYGSILAVFFKNLIFTKAIFVFLEAMWVCYEISAGLYGQAIGESIDLLINLWAFITLVQAARHGIPLTEVKEVTTMIREAFLRQFKNHTRSPIRQSNGLDD